MKKETFLSLLLVALFFAVTPSFAQISAGGTPPSFIFEAENAWLSSTESILVDFDIAAMRAEDAVRKLDNLPPRAGRIISVNFTTENSGEWTILPNGQEIWRLCIIAEDAVAIMLNYDKFEIPQGGKLFIYNDDRSKVLGAYTEESNPKKVAFATEFLLGDIITLEYVAPPFPSYESPIIISGVVYGYNSLFFDNPFREEETGDNRSSDYCEVNINCPEGANWQDQKRGVVRLTIPIGAYTYFCSASVVNNTAQDYDPLVLSAYHCYEGASTNNINQSIYYFHYEYVACTGNTQSTEYATMSGAQLLVITPMSGGSDGALLRLNQNIPASYNVYYNGWDRQNIAATSGVSIHHPDGDRKKISTYTTSLVSAGSVNFGGGVITAPNSAWRVVWAPTATHHGVTEGGSSGSPIFNQNKRIVGTLSGGSSYCTSPYSPDVYGKLWYHWDQMSNPSQHMKTYLDPLNTGVLFIDGTYAGSNSCSPASNLVVNYNADCEANLTWSAPSTASPVYNVYRDDNLIATNITTTSYTDKGFTETDPHIWAVKVVCSTEISNPVTVSKTACFVPVSNINNLPTTANAGVALTLTGTVVPSNATNKTISWSIENAGTTGATITGNIFTTTASGTATVKATVLNGLAPGTPYTKLFEIKVNVYFIPVSNIIDLLTEATVGIPLTLTGTVLPGNATNKTIEWSVINAGSTEAAIAGNIFNAPSVGSATVRATIKNGIATGDYTKDFNIQVTSVGIEEVINAASLKVYPNPTTGELKIDASAYSATDGELRIEDGMEFSIYSITGQLQLQGNLSCEDTNCQVATIKVTSLPNGMYYLKVAGRAVKFVKE